MSIGPVPSHMPTEAEKSAAHMASLDRRYGGDKKGDFERNRNDYLTVRPKAVAQPAIKTGPSVAHPGIR